MIKTIIFVLIFLQFHVVFASSDTAILLVDMQEGFIPNQRNYVAKNLIKKQLELLDLAKNENLYTLVFEYMYEGKTIEPIADSIKDLTYYSIQTKFVPGGFDSYPDNRHNIAMLLRSFGIKNVIITGINGPYCIYDTILGALKNDFNVLMSPDLVGNLAPGEHSYPNCSWSDIDHPNLYTFDSFEELADELF